MDFNNLTSYHLSEQGTKTVAKILAVIQNTNPEILYCPTLYAKLSIFLHYMGPSDAFNCIYALLRSKDANIMQTKVAVESSKLVLRDLTKKYAVHNALLNDTCTMLVTTGKDKPLIRETIYTVVKLKLNLIPRYRNI